MRLLFAIKSLNVPGGGAERVLVQVAGGLAARGHDVAILTFDSPGAFASGIAVIADVRSTGTGWVDAALGRSPMSGASPMIWASSALCRRSRSIRAAIASPRYPALTM